MEERTKTNNTLAWIALIVALLALWFGITATNRSRQDVTPAMNQQTQDVNRNIRAQELIRDEMEEEVTEEISETTNQMAARVDAEASLVEIRADIVANDVTDETVEQLKEVRTNLSEAYANADTEVRAQYEELDNDLETLETQIKDDKEEALKTMENVLERLRRDVLIEEN